MMFMPDDYLCFRLFGANRPPSGIGHVVLAAAQQKMKLLGQLRTQPTTTLMCQLSEHSMACSGEEKRTGGKEECHLLVKWT